MPDFEINIMINAQAQSLEEVKSLLEELDGKEINTTVSNDSSEVEDTKEELEEIDGSEEQTTVSTDDSEVEETTDKIDELDGKEAQTKVGVDSKEVDEANDKLNEMEDHTASVGTALAGIAGVVGLDAMVQKADNIKTSWNQLSLTFEGTGVSIDDIKEKSKELTAETGKSGGLVRDYFNQMGIAGITNVDLLSTSFKNMTGRAYQTGSSVEQIEGAIQKMVMSGNAGAKMLSQLGISSQDLADAMGVSQDEIAETFKSMDTEERLAAINKAMGDGTKANEMYKQSYAGLKEQASIAIGGLMSTIGTSVLPIVLPVLEAVSNALKSVTNIVKGLPSEVTGVIGAIGGGLFFITALVGVMGTLGMVISSVTNGIRSFVGAFRTARAVVDALRNAESISMGIKQAYAILSGKEAVEEAANTAAKEANAVATSTETAANEMSLGAKITQTATNWGLSASELAVLWPLLLIVGAVLAVVAVLWYLYNNNETVRNSIDALRNGLMNLVNQFVSFVSGIWNSLVGLWNNLVNWFNQLQTMTPQQILLLIANVLVQLNPFANLINGVLSRILPVFIRNASSWITGTVNRVRSLVNNVVNVVRTLPNRISSAINGVINAFTKPFRDAWNFISPILNQIQEGIDIIGSVIPSFGFDGNVSDFGVSDFGFDGTLNSTISSASNNGRLGSNTVNNNFNINGIIEEEASNYIVNSIASYTRKQNLIRGR